MKSACFLLLASGCIIAPGSSSSDDDDQTNHDVDQYNQLSQQYDQRRSEFLGPDVQELAPVGNQLFWLDTTNFDPKLDRYDDLSAQKLAYAFSIGDGDNYNYRASQ